MDAPQAARPSSHPSLLQFFRSLLGYPRSLLGAQEPRAEKQEQGAAVGPHSWQAEQVEPTHGGIQEHCEDEEGDSMELLLGELREVSLQGSLGSSTSRSCLTTSTSDVEVAVERNGMEAPGGTVTLQSDGAAGEERGAADEAVGRALVMDEFLQGLSAADEDTCSASPEPMFSMDLDTEWEKGHLLKAKQGAGSPKAELSLWNRFISVNRHQWTLRKARASRSSMELESEEQPLLRADESSPTSPQLPVLPAEPSAALPVYRFSKSRAAAGGFGRSQAELGANRAGMPGEG
ncbi:uncharacterized protein LOC109371080 isoform X2 [Meleagris gallopavo]|uniref:uncharacterized protein LOC109371080 isoform X2 n=1 Tax=Meleagris gallopavo TaxID=9103 RepID=UPI00093A8758|nr:uncharacterized protein LOC109371080 isoform X2 [Meleagris gallopavo]